MNLSELQALTPGSLVTVCCQLSNKPIVYRGPAEDDRYRVPITDEFTRQSRYTVEGRVVGIDDEGAYTFLVLRIKGEASVLSQTRSGLKVTGKETRTKIAKVPITAIRRIDKHAFGI